MGQSVRGRHSVALGIWFRVGSRDETPGFEGSAHMVEHLVFKGTKNRSAGEIAASLERTGGSLEAFTTKENTCFYARILEDHVDLAVDVLGDLVSNPLFDPGDVDLERKVILEELRTVEDTPEDLIGDLAQFQLWPQSIMGASILGTRESLAVMDARHLAGFHSQKYCSPAVVVSAAGAVDPDRLADLLERHLNLSSGSPPVPREKPVAVESVMTARPSEISQLHLQLSRVAPSESDPARRPVQLLTEILGGGMSSRLFQSIREKQGLAYSVQAYTEHFEDVGILSISLAVSPEKGEEAYERTLDEMKLLRRDGLRGGELDGAKAQVRGSLIMGMESLTHRMSHLAKSEYRVGRFEPVEDVIREYEAVTEGEVMEQAEELMDPGAQNLVALGPIRSETIGFKGFHHVVEAK